MKSIDEIKRMKLDDLERLASDKTVEVPSDLYQKVSERLMTQAVSDDVGEERHKARRVMLWKRASVAIAVAASVALAVLLVKPSGQKDTFEDPKLAYAQLEKTLGYISSKMKQGVDKARESEKHIKKTNKILENIR